jgi:N6-L-threonylcarbamoyladenine synthase
MNVLGIETSCDETAVGIVEDGQKLLSNTVFSSMDLHAQYGGVVPEIAARSHLEVIEDVLRSSLDEAGLSWPQIDAIAVTQGAGLGGSLLIGVLTATTLALVYEKPLFAVNHVIGHVYANYLQSGNLKNYVYNSQSIQFPALAIIVSGGHTQLAIFNSHVDYFLIGKTLDDAVGEAFDKVAKILGLPYPGGPQIAKLAQIGDPLAYRLPEAQVANPYDFSFSGPKTAVLRLAQREVGKDYNFPSFELKNYLNESQKANIAASFQYSVTNVIALKVQKAVHEFKPKSILLAGGVAANQELRNQLQKVLSNENFIYPDLKLCTDNGAMIATRAYYQIISHQQAADPYSLGIMPNLKM